MSVRDFGRGIPLGKVVECVSQINTGAKYNDDVFQFSVGLNGVGTKAVNALSKDFFVRSHREGECVEASFKQGKLRDEKKGEDARSRTARSSGLNPIRRYSRRPNSARNTSSGACAINLISTRAFGWSSTARPSNPATVCWIW